MFTSCKTSAGGKDSILSEMLFPFPYKLKMPLKITARIPEYLGPVTGCFSSKAIVFINRTTGIHIYEYQHTCVLFS